MNGFRKFLTQGSRILLGLVFFIAGVLKLMDPMGTSLIVSEYFSFFHLSFLKVISTPFGSILALLETTIGAALLTGVFRKVTANACAIVLGAFTMITFILWIFNPDMDCGCFGEAIHLTHFQSFLKNVILLLMALLAFRPYRMFKPTAKTKKVKYVIFSIVMVSVVAFATYSALYIPLVDFTPFNTSSMLAAAVEQEESQDEYVSTFIYEKEGQKGVFTLDKLPDSTWTYVETKTVPKFDKIIETDYPVLSFRNREGEYCDSLAAIDNVLTASLYKLKRVSDKKWHALTDLLEAADSVGMTSLLLVAADAETFDQKLEKTSLTLMEQNFLKEHSYFSDYKTLITMNRSNGGAVFFNDGNLIDKWAYRELPDTEDVADMQDRDATELMLAANTKGRLWFQAFLLYTLALMLIF